jgi:DNA-binding MarR family transcriptional regulator
MNPRAFETASGDLDTRLAQALAKLALAGRYALGRAAGRAALSPIQALLLDHLARRGPASVGELARLLGVTPPTISDSVAALERRGLVERRSLPADARRVLVHPTARGRRLGLSRGSWLAPFRDLVAGLSPADKTVLFGLLLRLIAALVARGVVRDARLCPTCAYFRPYAHADPARPHHCALVDLPLGRAHLRVDCPDHAQAPPAELDRRLAVLAGDAP